MKNAASIKLCSAFKLKARLNDAVAAFFLSGGLNSPSVLNTPRRGRPVGPESEKHEAQLIFLLSFRTLPAGQRPKNVVFHIGHRVLQKAVS